MRILTLNVRGFGNPVKWRYIKELIRKEDVRMLCFARSKNDKF